MVGPHDHYGESLCHREEGGRLVSQGGEVATDLSDGSSTRDNPRHDRPREIQLAPDGLPGVLSGVPAVGGHLERA